MVENIWNFLVQESHASDLERKSEEMVNMQDQLDIVCKQNEALMKQEQAYRHKYSVSTSVKTFGRLDDRLNFKTALLVFKISIDLLFHADLPL